MKRLYYLYYQVGLSSCLNPAKDPSPGLLFCGLANRVKLGGSLDGSAFACFSAGEYGV